MKIKAYLFNDSECVGTIDVGYHIEVILFQGDAYMQGSRKSTKRVRFYAVPTHYVNTDELSKVLASDKFVSMK